MAFELKQQMKLSQQLVMTPQLQQAIKLLQLNHLELGDLISQELVENPVLEEQIDERVDPMAEAAAATPDERIADPNAEGTKDQQDIDWEKYLEQYQSSPRTGSEIRRDFDDMPGYEQTLTRGESLADHLTWQLQMSDAGTEVRQAALCIIHNLDDHGYLRISMEDMSSEGDHTIEALDDGLDLVQTFDPVGVGARNLQECLLLQLDTHHPKNRLLYNIVADYMEELTKRNYKPIARGLRVPMSRIVDCCKLLAQLEGKPGREFSSDEPRYITPDIHVIKTGGEWVVQLNEDGVPKLRVSNYYKNVLSGVKKGDKEFIQEKLRSAQWLIRSIYQRQRTIYKVMDSIIKQQKPFFDEGIAKLKPMILRDVAEDIGMHESTVSRVTSNKYVNTPHGTFSLKFFFNSGIQRGQGEDVASEMVKQRIAAIVSQENPRKPYSDQKLVDILAKENIKIARRTVAKYRDMLNILSSSQRKRLF
jgi:RNA polymerase sigma-54 factor